MSSARFAGDWVAADLLTDRAERLGDRVAVRSSERDVSYSELADGAARVAAGLGAIGLEPGDRVATMLPSSVDYLFAWWGIVWAGGVDVPLNNDYRGELLERLIADSGARVLIIDTRWLGRLDGLAVGGLLHVVVVGGGRDVPLPAVEAHGLEDLSRAEAIAPTKRRERDLLYVMYTSGTTGPSKGVMHSNRSALWNAAAWVDILSLGEHDVAYSMFPLFHVTARSAVVTSTFWAGGCIHLGPGFSPSRFWDDVRAAGATFFAYMGIIIHLLHAQPARPDDADNPVRRAFGAAAPPGILEAFERRFGLELVEVYGGTELGVATAPRPGRRKLGTMGQPCPHLIVEIHDQDDQALPSGQAGEIVARPAEPEAITPGYWGDPRATIEAFRNLWFHTGDRGYLDEDGFLTFSDRLKDSLRRRGENVSSFEVERAVQRHPAVLECAAYAVPADLTEDEVMVALTARPGHEIDEEELVRFCAREMPRFMVPRYVRVVEALPKTPSQRIEKYRLREDGVTPDTFDREAAGLVVPRD